MRVVALKKHPYEGHERSPGEQYEMAEEFVKIMTLAGNVKPVEVQTRDMQPSEPKKYRRRDLRAD